MNANLGAQTHWIHHGLLRMGWKLWLAGVGIAILTGLGLYYAISEWLRGEIVVGLVSFGSLVGVAVAYAFGYFWCLPDVLGGISRNQSRTLLCRWSGFAFVAAFIGLLIINISYIRVIWVNFSDLELGRALAVLVASAWLLPACVVAAENYLGWTMPRGETTRETGWRARVRRAMGRFGSWLVTLVGAQRALVMGGGLALLSIILFVRADIFGPEYKGYQIVAGTGGWWQVMMLLPKVEVLLTQARRIVYILGLAVAVCAIASVLGGRLTRMIRSSGMLCTMAGTVALFEVTDVGVTLVPEYSRYFKLVLWVLIWVVPIAIWLGFTRSLQDQHNHTRLALVVFYLPIFLLGFAYLPFYTYLALGLGIFVVGMLLVWWGLVQCRWKIAQKQNPHPL